MRGYIYKITNIINSKIYIGQTINTYKRWKKHLSVARCGYEYNSCFYDAINKYGGDNFKFEIIEECEANIMDEREKYWIDKLNTIAPNGYNLSYGGVVLYGENNPFYNRKHSEETKAKISKANSGNKHTDEYKQYMSKINTKELNPFYGKTHTIDARKKISDAQTKEVRMKQSQKMKDNNPNKDGIHSKKPVLMIDKKTNKIIKRFSSATEAGDYCKELGLTKAKHPNHSVADVCRGIQKTAFGFKFKYIEEGVSTIENTDSISGSE